MEHSIIQAFLQQTKLCNMSESGKAQGLPRPVFEKNPKGVFDTIPLPAVDPSAFAKLDVADAILNRRSLRQYSAEGMTIAEISLLLWCTQGVRRVIPDVVTLRNAPSAGARNAFETFLLVNRVNGLEAGLYKYVALDHALLKITGDATLADAFTQACDEQPHVHNCDAMFIWTAVPERMTWSYAERSYRYLFLDAGHVCQNLYLAAEKLGAGVCAIGHYDDDRMNELLGIDGVSQFALYAATVGKKKDD